METYHVPVLLQETIKYLNVNPGEKYIDCTLGGGGHTAAILAAGGIVLGIDQDQEALEYVEKYKREEIREKKLTLKHGNFAHLKELAAMAGFHPVSGILFDPGVSSHQLETDYRGFSFTRPGLAKLDMRMNPSEQAVTASDLLNAGSEKELANLFWKFGEERDGRRIAKAIIDERGKGRKVERTDDLVRIILTVSKRSDSDRTHPATRVFQALRIAVNDELGALEGALPQAVELLAPRGRLVVISFHSLEDRIVKNYFKDNTECLQIITDKPVTPTGVEIKVNPRARSGKLRAAERK